MGINATPTMGNESQTPQASAFDRQFVAAGCRVTSLFAPPGERITQPADSTFLQITKWVRGGFKLGAAHDSYRCTNL